MNIAVLITCYNRKQKTLDCLKALFLQQGLKTDFNLEIFLVDDDSTDGTYDAVKSLFPQIHIIKSAGNLFWNRGMHLAWQEAEKFPEEFSYFFWLNDDTHLQPFAVKEMLSCASVFPEGVLVCAAISSGINGEFSYGGCNANGEKIIPDGKIQYCNLINGNCVLISKNVYTKIGKLDNVFLHAIGDHDYGLRTIAAGFAVITTRRYIGECERNQFLPAWCLTQTPFLHRIQSLYSPLANSHPYYYFIFERRHFGLLTAVKHFFSIHLRALMPALWSK